MDGKRMGLIMNILKFGLGVIGAIACVLIWTGPNTESLESVRKSFLESGELAFAINFLIAIVVGGLALILLFFLFQMVTNTKKTLMSIIGIVVAAIIYIIFWAMGTSDTNETLQLRENVQVSSDTIASTTAGIYTLLFAVIAAVASIFLIRIVNLIRN